MIAQPMTFEDICPVRVEVGSVRYRVHLVSEDILSDEGVLSLGTVNLASGIIRVCTHDPADGQRPFSHLRDTFIHECLHAVAYNSGDMLEEEKVHRLACALTDFLDRNPDTIDLFLYEEGPDGQPMAKI